MNPISFNDFCAKQFLGGQDKEAFRIWLGAEANTQKLELEWLRLFNEWQRSSLDKVVA